MLMLMRNDGDVMMNLEQRLKPRLKENRDFLGVSLSGGLGVCPTRKFGKFNFSQAALTAF